MTAPTSTTTCRPTVPRCGASGAISRSVIPDRATAALTRRAVATMIDDVVAEAREGLIRRHDPDTDRREQGEHRDKVIAQAPPDEEPHHSSDDGEGQRLRQGHARGPAQCRS